MAKALKTGSSALDSKMYYWILSLDRKRLDAEKPFYRQHPLTEDHHGNRRKPDPPDQARDRGGRLF